MTLYKLGELKKLRVRCDGCGRMFTPTRRHHPHARTKFCVQRCRLKYANDRSYAQRNRWVEKHKSSAPSSHRVSA